MTKNIVTHGILLCLLVLLTSCIPGNTKNTAIKSQPPVCDSLLYYHNELAIQTNKKYLAKDSHNLTTKNITKTCLKLYQAIKLSIPGGDHQNNNEALKLLNNIKQSETLSDSDKQLNDLLLHNISQQQQLRQTINTQKQNLKKIKIQNTILHNQLDTLQSQLNQLQNIEVEIDKKERSVTSPIGE